MQGRELRLGDVATLNYGKSLTEKVRLPGSIPVYSSSGVTGYHNESLCQGPSIVIGRKGNVGTIYYVNEPFYCIDTAYFVTLVDKEVELKFLYYLLKTLSLDKMNVDSAVPGLNRDTAYAQKLFIPPPAEQRRIAGILGAFDDQIEVLRQQNRTLEAMARALFRHWFVDFEFPSDGSGGVAEGLPYRSSGGRMKDSPLGPIPEGWEVGSLGDIVAIQNGYAYKSSDWRDVGRPVVKIGSVKPGFVDLNEVSYVEESLVDKKFELNTGDLLVGLTGYVGEVGLVPPAPKKPLLNQRVGKFVFNDLDYYSTIFSIARSQEFKDYAVSKGSGSAQQNISTKDLMAYPMAIPIKSISIAFNELIFPMLSKIISNHSLIAKLNTARDNLLPELLTHD